MEFLMKKVDTVRALRNAEYRKSLTAEQRSMLPTPAGVMEIEDEVLQSVSGGCCDRSCLLSCPSAPYCA